jgi:hypothetical protein
MKSQKGKRISASKAHDEMLAEWLNDPVFKVE